MLRKIITLSALLTVVTSAQAFPWENTQGVMLGFEGGIANVDWPSFGTVGGGSDSGNNLLTFNQSTKLFAGDGGLSVGYRIPVSTSFTLTPDVGYRYIGNFSSSYFRSYSTSSDRSFTANVNSNVLDFLLSAYYHTSKGLGLFAQTGMALYMANFSVQDTNNPDQNGAETNTSFRPEIGLGIAQQVSKRVELFCKFNYIFGVPVQSVDISANTPNVGMVNAGLSVLL